MIALSTQKRHQYSLVESTTYLVIFVVGLLVNYLLLSNILLPTTSSLSVKSTFLYRHHRHYNNIHRCGSTKICVCNDSVIRKIRNERRTPVSRKRRIPTFTKLSLTSSSIDQRKPQTSSSIDQRKQNVTQSLVDETFSYNNKIHNNKTTIMIHRSTRSQENSIVESADSPKFPQKTIPTTSTSLLGKWNVKSKNFIQRDQTKTEQSSRRISTTFPSIEITEETVLYPKRTTAAPITESLRHYQQTIAGPIVSSFSINEPYDPLLTDCHIQTIGGFLLRKSPKNVKYVPRNNINKATQQIIDSIILTTKLSISASQQQQQQQKQLGEIDKIDDEEESVIDSDGVQFWDRREKIRTADGDWFHADTKYASDDDSNKPKTIYGKPTVLLIHGLNSNSYSALSIDMAKAYVAAGMNCICLNFRGCSGIPNDTLRFYHLGFTDDLMHYIQLLNDRKGNKNTRQQTQLQRSQSANASPKKDPDQQLILYLAGFSLGANVVLKCLGELGEQAISKYNVYGAAVLCAPLDSVRNTLILGKPGINKAIYTGNLLRGLRERAKSTLDKFFNGTIEGSESKFDYNRGMAATTIPEFDDAFTSQLFGFDDCWDYYSQTSSIYYLPSIAVPTIIINAKDDPFFDPTVWPGSTPANDTRFDNVPPNIYLVQTDHGGHLGYSFHQVDDENDVRLQQQSLTASSSTTSSTNITSSLLLSPPCWASNQTSQFLQHIQNHPSTNFIQRMKSNTKINPQYIESFYYQSNPKQPVGYSVIKPTIGF